MATPTPTYSQESAVQAITSYYKFLENAYPYIQPDTVRYPPEDGWPTITKETLAPLHKTDTVVSLLRHIPYWRHSSGDYFCIAHKTWPLEYNNPDVQRWATTPGMEYRLVPVPGHDLPAHVIPIAKGHRSAYYFLLDTERGVIIWGCPTGGIYHAQGQGQELSVSGVDDDGPDWWKAEPTFEVEAFFETLKDKFRSLEWMPHPFGHTDVWEADDDEDDIDENTVALKNIMRDAGWPGDGDGGGWNKNHFKTEIDRREEEVGWI